MENIKVKNFGPIIDANINFGDITIFVGPQASGKSILLQLIKLIVDKDHIHKTIERYGYDWDIRSPNTILNRYFGKGMYSIWDTKKSRIEFDGNVFTQKSLINKSNKSKYEFEDQSLFYIPAQRVVCLANGWPRFFNDYDNEVPYVLRYFSETIRQALENNRYIRSATFFSEDMNLIKKEIRNSFDENIFHHGVPRLTRIDKKQIVLRIGDHSSLPFMVWSTGQKEFMPLLISFYLLSPSKKKSNINTIKYVIIEEPEMGLHPQAIKSILLQVVDLISRGYKVIISTHSPTLLEFAWTFNTLKKEKTGFKHFYELFEIKNKSVSLSRTFKEFLNKKVNTYFFDNVKDKVTVKDISTLDAGSDDKAVSEWGGLSSFSSKASEIVSSIMANE